MRNKKSIILMLLPVILVSCRIAPVQNAEDDREDRFNVLIEYLENEANYINGPEIPWFITAQEVYADIQAHKNILVIDLRDSMDYQTGHIRNSVNVPPSRLLHYMENVIEPSAYEKIVFACNNGTWAAFTATAMKYLGYTNIYPLRNGLSSWHHPVAAKYWLSGVSSGLSNTLDSTSYPKHPKSDYPVVKSVHNDGYQILRERVQEVLQGNYHDYFIEIDELMSNLENYYVVSYWPEDRYNRGHLHGSVQYAPKKSLHTSEDLNTLPLNQPIVLQCYTGNHTNFAAFFLRMIGYDAINLTYGANAFMYDIIQREERPGSHFAEKDVFNLPVSRIPATQ